MTPFPPSRTLPLAFAAGPLLLLLSACPSPQHPSDGGSERATERAPLVECATLGLDSCRGEPTCVLVEADGYDLGRECMDKAKTSLGCTSKAASEERETPALDSVGNCWIFSQSWLPDGFTEVVLEMEPSQCSLKMRAWPPCPPEGPDAD